MNDPVPARRFFLKCLAVGPMQANCYIIADIGTKDACLIDPGGDHEKIEKILRRDEFKLNFIINSHGHGDHIAANGRFHVPIYIHYLEKEFLTNPEKNLSKFFFFGITSPTASKLLDDGDTVRLGNLTLEIIHTPGHTPGSISIKLENVIFTGDALFRGSIGRTDFAYGDEKLLMDSIKNKLLTLPDDTTIYPGHGEESTIGEEKKDNPFFS